MAYCRVLGAWLVSRRPLRNLEPLQEAAWRLGRMAPGGRLRSESPVRRQEGALRTPRVGGGGGGPVVLWPSLVSLGSGVVLVGGGGASTLRDGFDATYVHDDWNSGVPQSVWKFDPVSVASAPTDMRLFVRGRNSLNPSAPGSFVTVYRYSDGFNSGPMGWGLGGFGRTDFFLTPNTNLPFSGVFQDFTLSDADGSGWRGMPTVSDLATGDIAVLFQTGDSDPAGGEDIAACSLTLL